MERIPILRMGPFLLVTIQVDMHDRLALTLQDDLTSSIVKNRARGVLIDISSLEIVDSFIGRMLGNIAAMSRVLDAETVVVGMRPAVTRISFLRPVIRTNPSSSTSPTSPVWNQPSASSTSVVAVSLPQ